MQGRGPPDEHHWDGDGPLRGPTSPRCRNILAVQRLVVVGQGCVGLAVALRACEQGFDVVGFDIDDSRVKRLAAGESTVEDIAEERLTAALATGRYLDTRRFLSGEHVEYL
jgi:UDP-N-acetyl-D-glucosamine dehydrogenase